VLIEWAGDDPGREGLIDTPARVARSYRELFAGYAAKLSAEHPRAYLGKREVTTPGCIILKRREPAIIRGPELSDGDVFGDPPAEGAISCLPSRRRIAQDIRVKCGVEYRVFTSTLAVLLRRFWDALDKPRSCSAD
jgi:hypothetical protein